VKIDSEMPKSKRLSKSNFRHDRLLEKTNLESNACRVEHNNCEL